MTTGSAGGTGGITKTGKKRLRNGCIFSLLFMGIGFYGGLSAAKRAIEGPDWMRRFTGIVLPVAPPVIPQQPGPNQPLPNVGDPTRQLNSQQPTPPPMQGNIAPGNSGPAPSATGSQPTTNATSAPTAPPVQPQVPPPGGWLVGAWEITDELHPTGSQASTVTSQYVFDDGGTGEFDINGKKQYDLHWEDANDYLLITFVTDTEGDQNIKVKMKYSLNTERNLLTLAAQGKKGPREMMFNVGPGVFHRK